MSMDIATVVRGLTMACLFGLLLAVGLRLKTDQLVVALRECRLTWILVANFVGMPLGVVLLIRLVQLPAELAAGMILLGAAPFAPVVPVFARMARADLALAAALTSLVPLLSAFLTPLACASAFWMVSIPGTLKFSVVHILIILAATVTAPLALGVAIHHLAPGLRSRILRPVEVVSEATGALSLIVVTAAEYGSILETGWVALVVMLIASEAGLGLGYVLGGAETARRRVVALGTSNRNIALALLLAVESFPGTGVASAVVANGLVLILMGLLHVAFWRFVQDRNRGG